MTNGPCDICREISSFGGLGMPCKPTTCGCSCHNRSRKVIMKETAKVLGVDKRGVIDNHKIVNFIKAGGGLNINSMKYGRHR